MAQLQIKLDGNTVINMPIAMFLFEYGIYAQEGTTVETTLIDGDRSLSVSETIQAPPPEGASR